MTALVTSWRCVAAFDTLQPVGLFMLPFQSQFDQDKEFRAFVSRQKVTAISQYHEAEDCGWGKHTDADLCHLANNVTLLAQELLKQASIKEVAQPDAFTLDVFCHASQGFAVEFIELNSFGAQLAAGSCLFDWVKDHELLYGFSNTLELRVISDL